MIPKINNSGGLDKGEIIYIILIPMGHLITGISSIGLVLSLYQSEFSALKSIDSNEF
jgi:hypothetical protein